MNKGLLTGTGVAVLAAFSLVWAASPVFAGQALIRAAKAGDEARLEQLVDFPALRQSMKDEFNAELVARMRRDPRVVESGLGGIGLMLAPMLLAGAVDAVDCRHRENKAVDLTSRPSLDRFEKFRIRGRTPPRDE
jgi:hypothetical protein